MFCALLFLFSIVFVRLIHIIHACSCISSLLLLCSITLYDYITFYLSVLQVDIWVIFSVFAVINNVTMHILELVYGRSLQVSIGCFSRSELLSHRIYIPSNLLENAKLFSKVVIPISICNGSCPRFWTTDFVIFVQVSAKWNLTVVLIWISLITKKAEHYFICLFAI